MSTCSSEQSDLKRSSGARRNQPLDETFDEELNPNQWHKQGSISTWEGRFPELAGDDDGYSAWAPLESREGVDILATASTSTSTSKGKSRRPRASDLNDESFQDRSISIEKGMKVKIEDESMNEDSEENEEEDIGLDRRRNLTPKPPSSKRIGKMKMREHDYFPSDPSGSSEDLEVEDQLLGSPPGRVSTQRDEEMTDSFSSFPSTSKSTSSSSYDSSSSGLGPISQGSNRFQGSSRLRSTEPESTPDAELLPPEIVEKLGKLLGIKFKTKESWKWAIRAITHTTAGSVGERFDKMSEAGDHALRLWYSNQNLDPDSDVECELSIHEFVSEKYLGQCAERKKVYQYLRHGSSIQFISNRMKAQCVKALIAAAWMNRRSMSDVQRAILKLGLLSRR